MLIHQRKRVCVATESLGTFADVDVATVQDSVLRFDDVYELNRFVLPRHSASTECIIGTDSSISLGPFPLTHIVDGK
jgi:hypothetical protein